MRTIFRRWLILPVLALLSGVATGQDVAPRFARELPNVPGKSLLAVEVSFAPGQSSLPHRHAKSAFIFAYVLSGRVRSQVEGEPAREYGPGESWYENPGAHHIQAANASATEPARFLAIFVVDSDDRELTTPDPSPPEPR
jgi:quercetin dioxygenase-like cupin family protein